MGMVKVIALEGADEAIIGTCSRDGENEVLVYNADLVQKYLKGTGLSTKEVLEIIEGARFSEHGDFAPVFVHMDQELERKIDDSSSPIGPPSGRLH